MSDLREPIICYVCKHKRKASEAHLFEAIRPPVAELILHTYPEIKPDDYICKNDLKLFRRDYVEKMLEAEKGELSKLDREVIKSMIDHETLARNVHTQFERKLTFGEHLSDKIAEFGGSWKFIIAFGVFMGLWISVNSVQLLWHTFDPYPYILLNLMLSCLAAIQAPIIMMSQNRRESKDRLRSENDYKVNLKAELQIRQLHEKIDYLTQQQWKRLLEIQQMQLELLQGRSKGPDRRSGQQDAKQAARTETRMPVPPPAPVEE